MEIVLECFSSLLSLDMLSCSAEKNKPARLLLTPCPITMLF